MEKLNMRDTLTRYGLFMPRRYKTREKQSFANVVHKEFTSLGYKVSIYSSQNKKFKGANLVIGDPFSASQILMAPYDTPSSVLLPGFKYYPFSAKPNIKQEMYNQAISIAIQTLCFVGVYFLFKDFMSATLWPRIGRIVGFVVLFLIFILFTVSRGNLVNFDRASAALAVLDKVLHDVKESDRHKLAVVFLDRSTMAYDGLRLLKDQLGDKDDIPMLYLDALAKGDLLVLARREAEPLTKLNKDLAELKEAYKEKVFTKEQANANFLSFFPKMAVLVSGEVEGPEFVVKNTRSRKDSEVDIERLELITKALVKQVARAKE